MNIVSRCDHPRMASIETEIAAHRAAAHMCHLSPGTHGAVQCSASWSTRVAIGKPCFTGFSPNKINPYFGGRTMQQEYEDNPRGCFLVLMLTEADVTEEEVEAWTPEMREEAEKWAAASHLEASDNDIDVPPRPDFIKTQTGPFELWPSC